MSLFDFQMGMFEFTPSLPKADNTEQWIRLSNGAGFVTVPDSVVKWKPDWTRQWGYVKDKPAVAELHHWIELEQQKGWVHMPTIPMDVPLDALLPLRLSNISMLASAVPLSVIVARPPSCDLYDFAEASFAAVAVAMAEACEEWCGHVQNEHRKGEARIQPLADDVYASDRVLRPTVVVPAAICHDAVVVWDRRMLGGEEYTATAFGVQLEFAQWMGELPRLRVAVLTFNVQCPSGVTMEELEALAMAIVLGGFRLVACFGDCEFSVGVAANEVMLNIARCGVLPIVMQEEDHQVVFRTLYPSDASAVAGSKPAVAGRHNPLTLAGVNDIADYRCPNRF